MPSKLLKSPLPVLLLTVVALVVLGSAYGLGNSAGASDAAAGTSGTLDVGGVVYEFVPTTCTITSGDFVAAGSGVIEGEQFWVTASGDELTLAVGPVSELELPDDGELWLSSIDEIEWNASGPDLQAASLMQDERDANAVTVLGELSVNCGTA